MVRLSSRSVVQKCHHDNKEGKRTDGEDRISGLPDEIIVTILSRLTLREAMSTSILSRRWRCIWTFITSSLSFDTGEPLCPNVCKVCLKGEAFRRQRERINTPKFVRWVNHVVKEHQGCEVDQFRVCYSLDRSYSSVLDTWVSFAFQKRVRELELNLTKGHGYSHSRCYSFPSVEMLNMLPLNLTRLISLRLMNVDVTAEVVQYFLANCPFLEQLCVVESRTLSSLKIGGESLKLKYLDLYRCTPLENLEIFAPNLVSLAYSGPKKEVPFKNVPLLSELCLGDEYCESFILEAPKHSSYLSQVEKLTLVLPHQVCQNPFRIIPSNLPKLFNLKLLELRIGINRGICLDHFTSLIKAAPLLSKFVLKLAFIGSIEGIVEKEFQWGEWRGSRTKHYHQSLKEVEFVGFTGHETDSELALHLLKISVSLEKITIDTHHPGEMWGPNVYCEAFAEREAKDREGAKERAQPLKFHVPAGAELVIV